MSSTSRGKQIENDDFYATPSWVVAAILPHLPVSASTTVLDPCCGEGAILDTVRALRPGAKTHGIELDQFRANVAGAKGHIVEGGNALLRPWPADAPVIVQNPPFSRAEEFVRQGIAHVLSDAGDAPIISRGRAPRKNRASAVLLRLAFLESEKRIELHREFPCDVYPLAYRPSFAKVVSCAGDGTSTKGCGWRVSLPLTVPAPDPCPSCMGRVRVNTSDSCAYAWFVWGPGRGGRIKVLTDAPPNARKPKPAPAAKVAA